MKQSILSGLDDLHDRFWSVAAIKERTPRPGIVVIPDPRTAVRLDVDVCIVTYCSFPGGNAATTVTEARALAAAGHRVAIIHCSIKKSRWKWNWVSQRYASVMDMLYPSHRVRRITCRKAIIRGPRMMMTENFRRLAGRIEPDHALFVVNNSARSEDGRAIFSWPELHARIDGFGWPSVELCPTGPIIRDEAQRDMAEAGGTARLSPRDWPPVIDADDFNFQPRAKLSPPVVIGRHARDHPGKWLEDREDLLQVYPADDPKIRVAILGGAETVDRYLGGVPESWEVRPFGLDSVQDYLATLDVFVNFPSPMRYEAFGRTIVEAVLSGLPVILPPRFEATFGDLAFYCSTEEVRGLIDRIAADDAGRLAYLEKVRDLATELFCAPSLAPRLEDATPLGRPRLEGDAARWRQGILSGA